MITAPFLMGLRAGRACLGERRDQRLPGAWVCCDVRSLEVADRYFRDAGRLSQRCFAHARGVPCRSERFTERGRSFRPAISSGGRCADAPPRKAALGLGRRRQRWRWIDRYMDGEGLRSVQRVLTDNDRHAGGKTIGEGASREIEFISGARTLARRHEEAITWVWISIRWTHRTYRKRLPILSARYEARQAYTSADKCPQNRHRIGSRKHTGASCRRGKPRRTTR